MIEVERKRALPDVDVLRRRLADLGYAAEASTAETDVYYSRPDVDFMETVECLRIRRRGEFAEATYKPPSNKGTHSDAGVIAKHETNVRLAPDQAEPAQDLLVAIGMVELATVEKHRTVYRRREGALVSIDHITGVGDFVEVEVLSPKVDEATAVLEAAERELGLDGDVVTLPYRDLVMQAR
ncbi:class IV adenylate cyclase [Nocardia callitridis]|uniref:class IV adenylate cyclase n=1 Tax=Nocardia callitridis TaxID=648753 RepID=UPI0031E904C0